MDISAIQNSSDIRHLEKCGNLIVPEGRKETVMIELESLQKLLLSLVQYYMLNGYYYMQIVHYPTKKEDKWTKIDAKLSKKFSLNINKGQRAYRRRKKQANFAGLRYKNICFLLHTKGLIDIENEDFIDLREAKAILDFGSVVKIELKFEGNTFIVKYQKRSYQDLKEIIKQIASNSKVWQHKNELLKIKSLPAVRRKMHLQKEHLIQLYEQECRKHNRKAYKL